MKAISLGWGIQSWGLCAMVAKGILPSVDVAIHSDTGYERHETYAFAAKWTPWLEEHGVRVVTVRVSNTRFYEQSEMNGLGTPPVFTVKTSDGDFGQMLRSCTQRWKIAPMRRWMREQGATAVEQWIGISLDEIERQRLSDVQWITNVYPLLDFKTAIPTTSRYGISRSDIVRWLQENGLEVPVKSACVFCLAGETEVITPQGALPIRDLVGLSTLLVPIPRNGFAKWQKVEVRSFGVQRLMKITLRRGRAIKVVHATPEHRWIVKGRNGCWQRFVATHQLKSGDVLPVSYVRSVKGGHTAIALSPFGIAAGFVFGDGSISREGAPATVTLFGEKDKVMMPYYALCNPYEIRLPDGKTAMRVYGLPRQWKELPLLSESKGYLLGWLAGYFAADGHVSLEGQATLYSVSCGALNHVRDICYLLGVHSSPVRTRQRQGINGIGPLSSVDLYTRDLPLEFWLHAHHRERIEKQHLAEKERRTGWAVYSVELTERLEEVFCAAVPGAEAFVLADNLVTGNCPYHDRATWRAIQLSGNGDWEKAVQVDEAIRHKRPGYICYLNSARKPLADCDFRSQEEYGQLSFLEAEECQGMCFL